MENGRGNNLVDNSDDASRPLTTRNRIRSCATLHWVGHVIHDLNRSSHQYRVLVNASEAERTFLATTVRQYRVLVITNRLLTRQLALVARRHSCPYRRLPALSIQLLPLPIAYPHQGPFCRLDCFLPAWSTREPCLPEIPANRPRSSPAHRIAAPCCISGLPASTGETSLRSRQIDPDRLPLIVSQLRITFQAFLPV